MKKIFLLSVLITQIAVSQTFDKSLTKTDLLYKIGEYNKAKTNNDLTIKRQNSPSSWFRAAMINHQLGNFKEVFPAIDKGLNIANSLDKKSSAYLYTLSEASEAYSEAGNQRFALKLIKQADSLYRLNKLTSVLLNHKIRKVKSIVQLKSGYYNEAIKGFLPLIADKGNLIFSELRDPDSGKKFSKSDLQVLKEEYARLMTYAAQTYFEKGNYTAADSLFGVCDQWINKNLGSKANERVINKTYWARFNTVGKYDYVNGIKETSKALKMNNKTWFNSGKSLRSQSKEIVELKTDLYKYYIAGKDFKTVENIQGSVVKAMKSAYGNQSSNYHFYKNKTDAEYFISRLMIKKAETSLEQLLEDSLKLGSLQPKRFEALNMMYQFKLNTGQTSKKTAIGDDFSVSLKEKIKVGKYLFGENAPIFQYDKIDYANYLTNYAYKFSEAEAIYKNGFLSILKPQLDPSSTILPQLYNDMASHYELTENFNQAFDYYANSADMLATTLGDKSNDYASQLEKLAKVQFLSGYYKDAEKTIDKSSAIFNEMAKPDKEMYMNVLVTKASIKNALGDFDESKKSLHKSVKLSQKLDVYSADIENNAVDANAYMLLDQGKYRESEELLKVSINDKLENLPDGTFELIKPYLSIGYINYVFGNYAEAENYYNKALKISKDIFGDNSIKAAECYYKLQKLKYAIGDYDKAKELLQKVIGSYTAKFEDKHIFLVSAYLDLSNLYIVTKEPDEKTDELLSKALEIVSKYLGEEHSLYAETIKNIAKFYIKTGNFVKAEMYLNKSAAIFKEKQGRKNLNIAEIYTLKGDLNLKSKNLKEAESNYEKALKIYAKALSIDHPSYVYTQSKLAKVYYLDNKSKKAITITNETTEKYINYIAKYFPALSEREKLKFWNLIKEDFEFFNFLAINNYKQDPSLIAKAFNHSLVTKSVLLNNSIKIKQTILNSGDVELIANYNNFLAMKEQLTMALALSDEEKNAQGISIKNMENDINEIEKELSKKSDVFSTGVKIKRNTWIDVRDALGEKETAIEMLRIRYYNGEFTDSVIYAAMTINKKSTAGPEFTLLPEGKELEGKQLKYYRNQIKFKMEDEMSFGAFWDPIYAKIPKGNNVYFSPEGVYNQLNLETLRLPDGSYVLDVQDISVVNNFSSLIDLKKKKQTKYTSNLVYILGNPQFYNPIANDGHKSIQQLPGTEVEAQTISDLFSPDKWQVVTNLDTSASEKNFKNNPNPRIVHIATHGFFREINSAEFEIYNEELTSPLNRSGVLLKHSGNILADGKSLNFNTKDGILTASEAMNLYMDKTELVVLSACETGLGQVQAGEGVYGLQRSFLVAGAGGIIMSLFKVDDEATKQLMIEFYKNWLKTGNKHTAFVEAKRTLKKTKPQPIYWGAFVMVENR